MARKAKDLDFEQALKELEVLIERMEDGELSLEDSLKTYERGMQLSRRCQRALDEAEQRMKILTEQDGEYREFRAVDLEPDDDEPG